MRKLLQLAIFVLLATAAFAVQDCASTAPAVSAPCVAQLVNGFEIRLVRREIVGDNVRLYLTEASYTELPAALIVGYEADPTPAPAAAKPAPPAALTLDDHIASAGHETGVDEDFIRSVIKAESGANPKAVSPKGARGLMQLMPATAVKLGVTDSFDPAQNIHGGTVYLRDLLVKYNGDAIKALAAYNAGPQRVEQYHGVPPYYETRSYVARVIRDYNRRKDSAAKAAAQSKNQTATVAQSTTTRGE